MGIINDFATAGYLVFTKKVKDELNPFGLIFYNTLISFPLMLFISFLTDEFTYVTNFEYLGDWLFLVSFIGAGLMAFAVNLTTAWCTQVNSALTTSVVGQTKNVLLAAAGAILFADFAPNLWIIVGISVSIFGSMLYAWVKLKQKEAPKLPTFPKP